MRREFSARMAGVDLCICQNVQYPMMRGNFVWHTKRAVPTQTATHSYRELHVGGEKGHTVVTTIRHYSDFLERSVYSTS